MSYLSDDQKDIVDTSGNMIVRASAGTGKTHTMVSKIAKEIEDNHSHKVIAAITFTIKAAKEIRERLTIDTTDHFIGTNNSFAIEEIIKPFIRDVYGNEYNLDLSTDYSVRKQTYEECLHYLRENGVICSFEDNKKNFVFELALTIVKNSRACRLYLQAKYFKIYVDEYQDCDRQMHEFFMYMCDSLNIELFVVGDEKQSIYIWRGAYPDAFKSIWTKLDFKKKRLNDNFRSCRMIQNYSNLLNADTRNLYSKDIDLTAITMVTADSSQWLQNIVPYLDLTKRTALLRFRQKDAEEGACILSSSGTDFVYVPKTPISDITTDAAWLYDSIAKYFILDRYTEYDFMDEVPEEAVGNRKILRYVKTAFEEFANMLDGNDDDSFVKKVAMFADYFGYVTNEDHTRKLIDTIKRDEFHAAFHMDELEHVAITFHSSKGLEYDQVIVFASDYPLDKPDSVFNHYVAVTRAKSKLIIVLLRDDWKSKKYYQNLKTMFAQAGVQLQEVITIR